MDYIIGQIGGGGLWSIGLAGLFAYWLFIFAGLHEDASRVTRDRWVRRLRYEDWGETYRTRLDAALDRVDGWLTPEKERLGLVPLRTAWSFGALNLTLLLAVLYPILSLLLQWAWTGAAGEVGGQVVIPAEPDRLPRIATICGIVMILIATWRVIIAATVRSLGHFVTWTAISAGLVGAFALTFILSGTGSVSAAIGGAGAGILILPLSAAAARNDRGALTISMAAAFSIAAAGGYSIWHSVIGAFILVLYSLVKISYAFKIGVAMFLIYCIVLLLIITAAIPVTAQFILSPFNEEPRPIILFLAVLPS